ncbi:46141_t:CDS:2, partial [Gigaspora margarita]
MSSDDTKSESVNNSDDSEIIVRTIVSGASFSSWESFEENMDNETGNVTRWCFECEFLGNSKTKCRIDERFIITKNLQKLGLAPTQNAQQMNALDCLGLLGLGGAGILSQSSTISTFTFTDSNNSNILNIEVTFHNVGIGITVQNLLFQAAISKTQKLQMQPPSSTGILPSAIAQQTICVTNLQK